MFKLRSKILNLITLLFGTELYILLWKTFVKTYKYVDTRAPLMNILRKVDKSEKSHTNVSNCKQKRLGVIIIIHPTRVPSKAECKCLSKTKATCAYQMARIKHLNVLKLSRRYSHTFEFLFLQLRECINVSRIRYRRKKKINNRVKSKTLVNLHILQCVFGFEAQLCVLASKTCSGQKIL